MDFSFFITTKVAKAGSSSYSWLIIRIAIVAIAIGMSVLILASSLINGFQKEITNKIFGFWGHIHITGVQRNRTFESEPMKISDGLMDSIRNIQSVPSFKPSIFGKGTVSQTKGGVRHLQKYALQKGIIKTKDNFEGIVIKGVAKDYGWQFLKNFMVDGNVLTWDEQNVSKEIMISQSTSRRMKLKKGDKMTIHFVKNEVQLKRRFVVGGIYKTSLEEFDKRFALVDIRVIQQLNGWAENEVSGVEVMVDDLQELEPITSYIYMEKLPNKYYAESIREKFPGIFEWLKIQSLNEQVIIFLILIVFIINMVTVFLILILERTSMIGILKSLGTKNWAIQKIFLYYAAFIVSVGLFFGNILGIGLALIQKYFSVIKLSEEDYYLSVAPIDLDFVTIVGLNIGIIVVVIFFLIIPSYLVRKINPVQAIRMD